MAKTPEPGTLEYCAQKMQQGLVSNDRVINDDQVSVNHYKDNLQELLFILYSTLDIIEETANTPTTNLSADILKVVKKHREILRERSNKVSNY